tara:strand:- start:18210 stop:19247 length:1038 start_codon:yes stop_codon:yes gene_type:complete
MLVTYIRSSSYNNYAYCEMQYFMTYVLGYQSKSGKKADMGTMVHKVMEVLAGLKKYEQDKPKVKFLKVDDDAIGKFKCRKEELQTDDLVNTLIGLSIDSYAKNSPHKFTTKDRQEIAETAWCFLNHSDRQFDPRLRNIHFPEPHFDIPIEEDWAKFEYERNGEVVQGQLAIKGTIDLVTKINDETIEVVDWKTGRRMDWATGEVKDYKKLENDPQLLLYYYAISKLYPEFPNRIMSIFFYKDKDGDPDPSPFSICFSQEDEGRFLEMLKNRVQEIRENMTPKPLDYSRKHWKCNRLCHFCKTNWPDTDQNMCIYIENHIKEHGMEKTVQECTREGFDIGFYEAPG